MMNAALPVADAACPACGSGTEAFLQSPDFNRHLAPGMFDYRRCTSCGYVFLTNPPEDLSAAYPQDYYIIADSMETMRAWGPHEQYKLDILTAHMPKGRLLEIGPGNGTFAFIAKRAGFDVHAIEMDERCAQYLSAQLGVKAIHSSDETAALAGSGPFDAICLWQVIEHLRDPFALIAAAAREIRPGGVLILATPNPESLQFRKLGRHWVHLDAPRHVCLIPIHLMAAKCEAAGFKVEMCTTTDKGSLSWNEFGWEYSLQTYVRAPLLRRLAARLGRIVARVMASREQQGREGTAYTMVLRRVAE